MSRIFFLLFLAGALLLSGCTGSWFCQHKDSFLKGYNLMQAGYSQYVKESGNSDARIILADQIAAMAGPYIQGGVVAICPPEAVTQAVAQKVAQLQTAPAPPTPAPAP